MWMMLAVGIAAAVPMDRLDWVVVNDSVMGGVSTSQVRGGAPLVFSGVLSLENNGGFASTRARVPEGTFADVRAIRLKLDGDGRTYDLTLRRRDVPLRAGSYRVPVPTERGRTTVEVPLSAFRPTSFGRPVDGAPALDAGLGRIDTIGLILADKQPGPFRVRILDLTLVRDDPPERPDRGDTLRVLAAAIASGVPQFNRGDVVGCRDTYAAALRATLAADGLTAGERAIVDDALAVAADQRPDRAAWTLRHAMGSVLYTGDTVR